MGQRTRRKDPTGPALAFAPAAWRAFVTEFARRA
ncbi:DUF397 domain-containing protein [Micromonospora vinacea]|nr:DUF397 domain-containing protein [Micromonospora sp. NBC_00860]